MHEKGERKADPARLTVVLLYSVLLISFTSCLPECHSVSARQHVVTAIKNCLLTSKDVTHAGGGKGDTSKSQSEDMAVT